jgi:hypothetical protein
LQVKFLPGGLLMEKTIDTDEIRSEVAFAPDKDGRFFDIIHELCREVDRLRAGLERRGGLRPIDDTPDDDGHPA